MIWRVAPDSEESSFRPDGMVRTLRRLRVFVFSIRRRFDERLFRRSFARQLLQPRAQLLLAVGQRVRLCLLEGLGMPESRQHQLSEDRFVFPLVTVHKTTSTSFRRSSMRKWWNCTFLHSTVLTQEQSVYIGVKVEGPFTGGYYCFSDARFIQGRKIAEVVDLGELFADRARVRDDPGMRAQSRRTI